MEDRETRYFMNKITKSSVITNDQNRDKAFFIGKYSTLMKLNTKLNAMIEEEFEKQIEGKYDI